MFQGYGPTRYRKCKKDITIPRERGPIKEEEKLKGYKERGNPNTRYRERGLERVRERNRKPL